MKLERSTIQILKNFKMI